MSFFHNLEELSILHDRTDIVNSSTPQESELIQLNTLVLNAETYRVEQLLVLNGGAITAISITVIDTRTTRVHLSIIEDFFQQIPVGERIDLSGFATVKDLLIGTTLTSEFALKLELAEDVSLSTLSSMNFVLDHCLTFASCFCRPQPPLPPPQS